MSLPAVAAREMRFLSDAQLERLVSTLPDQFRGLVSTAGYIGVRWGELVGLKQDRLNLTKGTVEVVETLVEINGCLTLGHPKAQLVGVYCHCHHSSSYVFGNIYGITPTRGGSCLLDGMADRSIGVAFASASGCPL